MQTGRQSNGYSQPEGRDGMEESSLILSVISFNFIHAWKRQRGSDHTQRSANRLSKRGNLSCAILSISPFYSFKRSSRQSMRACNKQVGGLLNELLQPMNRSTLPFPALPLLQLTLSNHSTTLIYPFHYYSTNTHPEPHTIHHISSMIR